MDSLATVLRRIPLFADLPPGSFAKIIADLREEQHPAGAVICNEGDAAHDFYIVKSGQVEILVNRSWNQRELVAVNGPHEWFGERALFSDRSRSATVVARTDVVLWRLTKEKFDALIEENPWLILHFTQVLSDRLYSRNQELTKVQAAFSDQMNFLFQTRPADEQAFLMRTAVLTTLEPTIVSDLTGRADATHLLATLATTSPLLTRHNGSASYSEAVREFLLGRLTAEAGMEGVRALHRHTALLYEQIGGWDQAIDHYLEAQDVPAALRLLLAHAEDFRASGRVDLLHKWIDRIPADVYAQECEELRQKFRHSLQPDQPNPVTASLPGTPSLSQNSLRQWIGIIAGLVLGIGIWFAPPLAGLNPTSMHMLALLAWAIVYWAFDVLPDYVVGLGMIIGWILFTIVPPEVAVSGFTTGPFFLIIGVLGMTAALQSSGLLFRVALYILRSFPLSYRGQSAGLALSGTAITSCIPDTTSGSAIAGPIILALSDSLGYARLSRGSAGLAMAALLGFGQMSPFFLTGAAENLLAWGLLPEAVRTQISWGSWALAALPLALVTFALAFTATMLMFPPEFQPTISRGLIDTQIEALGPPSRAEIVSGCVVLGALIGWVTGPYHGVDAAWVAMIGLTLLLATDLLDRTTFRSGINWDFLFYLGAVLSLTSVVHQLGIDEWVIQQLTPLLEPFTAYPARFLVVMAVAIFAARFILPSFPLVSLLTLTIVPIATNAGIHPQVLILVICTCVAIWFLPYQSTCYLALYFGTKEKAFTHSQVRLLAWSYGVIYLLAILVALPYWRWLALMP